MKRSFVLTSGELANAVATWLYENNEIDADARVTLSLNGVTKHDGFSTTYQHLVTIEPPEDTVKIKK